MNYNKEIAKVLRQVALQFPEEPTDETTTFTFGTFRISCRAYQAAINQVAGKFEKGPKLNTFSMYKAWSELGVLTTYREGM